MSSHRLARGQLEVGRASHKMISFHAVPVWPGSAPQHQTIGLSRTAISAARWTRMGWGSRVLEKPPRTTEKPSMLWNRSRRRGAR